MLLGPAQLVEHGGQLHGFVHIAGGHQQLADIHPVPIAEGLQEVVQVQHADDVIDAVLIHRQAGIRRFLNNGEDVVPIVVNIDGADIHPGGHDLQGGDIGKINGGLQQLGLILVQHILHLGGLNDGL